MLTWEKGRQLKSFDNNTYTYNANGIRTSKTIRDNEYDAGVTHTYTLDGTKILRETWEGNTLIPIYDNEDSICGIIYNSVRYYFLKNLQGDIIEIVDKDAATVAKYSYDAWGVPTIISDISECKIATINPFRYRGYYYDQEIELYYLQSRYYDAGVGRFMNLDYPDMLFISPFTIPKNFFSYCECDCINKKDNLGLFSISRDTFAFLVDVAVSVVSAYAKYAYDLIGMGLKAIFEKKGKKFFMDVLLDTVPKIKGWLGGALTAIRTVLWRIGYISLSYIIGKIQGFVNNTFNYIISLFNISSKSKKNAQDFVDVIFCLFSTGGIIALFFDIISDGSMNKKIKIF